MATQIRMPQLSDTMETGRIIRWNKNEGDSVKRGESLAEVETEKANLDIESFHEGVLLRIFVPADETAGVGEVIALIGEAGETTEIPAAAVISAEDPNIPQPVQQPEPVEVILSDQDERIKASPLARKIAEERNLDLRGVTGSGPEGRIIRKDVEDITDQQAATGPVAGGVAGRTSSLSKMRSTIAQRMQQSVMESPHFYVTAAINMGETVKLHRYLREQPGYEQTGVNHLIIKAAAWALSREPGPNRCMKNGNLFEPDHINLGIVTAVDDGLLIPVIQDADKLPFQQLVAEARAAVDRARAGRPTSADLSGGTFSISNMGMFDVESFTAIINPGQGAILAVSSIREEAVVENGQIRIGRMMRATLSSDHRVVDGVKAAMFLKFFKEALQSPALLFI